MLDKASREVSKMHVAPPITQIRALGRKCRRHLALDFVGSAGDQRMRIRDRCSKPVRVGLVLLFWPLD
jgi:hypothetical protein